MVAAGHFQHIRLVWKKRKKDDTRGQTIFFSFGKKITQNNIFLIWKENYTRGQTKFWKKNCKRGQTIFVSFLKEKLYKRRQCFWGARRLKCSSNVYEGLNAQKCIWRLKCSEMFMKARKCIWRLKCRKCILILKEKLH